MKELVEELIEKAAPMRVLVVGETIIDAFVDVSYEGQSMKSMCPVFKLEGSEDRQVGGAGAIAGHLKDFVSEVRIITNENEEIVKTRYQDVHTGKKHVEINKFDTAGFKPLEIDTEGYDCVIIADFGHGFCEGMQIEDGFHLMCQTNSNNFGFNRVSKWKDFRKKSICLDLREASLQMNRKVMRNLDEEIHDLYKYELNTDSLLMTLGKEGSMYTDGEVVTRQKTFPSEIVDTIGAGDTFFGFSALAVQMGLPPEKLMTVPALAASLSTTWLCNEKSVNKEMLQDYALRFI